MRNKRGLKEFRMDVNFFEWDIVKFVAVECGAAGVCVIVKLLTEVFKNGFWLKWGEDEQALLAWEMHGMVTKEEIGRVVAECLRRGYFSSRLYATEGILTSEDIQRRYMQATRSRKQVEIEEEYWLLEEIPRNAMVIAGEDQEEMPEEVEKPEPEADAPEPKPEKTGGGKTRSKKFVPPTEQEVVEYFRENGYKEEIARKAWNYYDQGGWTDSSGKPVKNWKQKMYVNWFRPEHAVMVKKEEYEGCIDF